METGEPLLVKFAVHCGGLQFRCYPTNLPLPKRDMHNNQYGCPALRQGGGCNQSGPSEVLGHVGGRKRFGRENM